MVMTEQDSLQILVVEDDDDTSEVICTLLENAGYQPHPVATGEDALDSISRLAPDLVLLDIKLPDINGLEVLRAVRAYSFLPMIVLSGVGQDRDRIVALESGADDYLGKPFSPEELVARVRALLRRVEWTPNRDIQLRVRDLELDLPRRQVILKGKRLHLTPVEYGILVTLMRKAGVVVSHDELLHAVWGDSFRSDYSVLRVNVSRLRQKVESNPRRPTYVVTAPGRGYWMPVKEG